MRIDRVRFKPFDHPLLVMAKKNKWKVKQTEQKVYDGAKYVLRTFYFRKTYHPTVKVVFKDDRVLVAYRMFNGEILNRNQITTDKTVRKWLRAVDWSA